MTRVIDPASLDLREFLKPGDSLVLGQACGEPSTLVEALIAQGRDIGGLGAFIATSFSGAFTPETAESFALSSMGAIGALRSMTKASKLSRHPLPCRPDRAFDRAGPYPVRYRHGSGQPGGRGWHAQLRSGQ